MIRKLIIAGLVAALLPASFATAHPGHGKSGEGDTLEHYLTEPVHLLAAAAGLGMALAVVILVRKILRAQRRSSRRQLET